MEITTSTIELEKAINNFQIAQNYFSDILNSQLIIFSIIVGALIAFYFLFNWKISKDQIKREVQEAIKEIKEKIREEFEEKNRQITENLARELIQHKEEITILRGEISRQMAQFWDSEKSFSVAFIWWIRAAHHFARANDENMTRISLSSAKESVEKIIWGFELNYDLIGEYQRLFSQIDDKLYKLEKDLLDNAIKDALNRKPELTK